MGQASHKYANAQPDHYQLLGVTRMASAREIKRAYYRRAKQIHPDVTGNPPGDDSEFAALAGAYETLADPKRRKQYDRRLSMGLGADPINDSVNWEEVFLEVQKELLGNPEIQLMINEALAIVGHHFRKKSPPVKTYHLDLSIPLPDIFEPQKRIVRLGNNRYSIRLPPGIKDGELLRFSFHQEKDKEKVQLRVRCSVEPPAEIVRKGADLQLLKTLSVLEMLRGKKVTFDYPFFHHSLDVPDPYRSDQILRFAGRGLPHRHRAEKRGDIIVRIILTYDSAKLTPREATFFQPTKSSASI